VFVPGKPFQSGLIFAAKAKSLPLMCFTMESDTILANIRLSWKVLPGTNTLVSPAYYLDSKISDINSFITLAPGASVIKLLSLSLTKSTDKL
jgi:hypothetical protein